MFWGGRARSAGGGGGDARRAAARGGRRWGRDGRCGAAPPRRALGGRATDGNRQAQRRERCSTEALVCGGRGARRILDGPVFAAATGRAVGGSGKDASGRPAAALPDRGVRPARVARRSGAVVGAAALGGRTRVDPVAFTG